MCCMTYFRETFLSDQENSLFGGEMPSQLEHGFLTAWYVLDRSDTERTQSHPITRQRVSRSILHIYSDFEVQNIIMSHVWSLHTDNGVVHLYNEH